MNPTAADIVESRTWTAMIESLARSYFDRFVATDPNDVDGLHRIRRNLEALHEIDRELHDLARAKPQQPRG